MIPRPPFLPAQKRLARRLSEWGLTVFLICLGLAALWWFVIFVVIVLEPRR